MFVGDHMMASTSLAGAAAVFPACGKVPKTRFLTCLGVVRWREPRHVTHTPLRKGRSNVIGSLMKTHEWKTWEETASSMESQ